MHDGRTRRRSLLAMLLLLVAPAAHADGFQLERFEPAAPGSWFFGVEQPWYSSTRYLAAGLVLDYGHAPLLGGTWSTGDRFHEQVAIVEHQLVGHVQVAGSLFDRVQLHASLPVVLVEEGQAADGVDGAHGAAVGDPRVGVLVRVWGHAERDPISLHAGVLLWIPVGGAAQLAGDPSVRGMPEIVLAGLVAKHVRWAFAGGVMLRADTRLGSGPASAIGSELQLRAGVGFTDERQRFHVGPELTFSTAVTGADAFTRDATGIELLLGGQWSIARLVQVGAAVGTAALRTLGTPDARVIVSLAYAPVRPPTAEKPRDSDGDGVPDAEDACPTAAGPATGDAATRGCPPARDTDGDGVPEAEDLCPGRPAGAHPDPTRKGCPEPDPDGDGVPEAEDLCPDQTAGAHPDPARRGCPSRDVDGDGVPEAEDLCPDQPAGAHPDPTRKGCPARDSDGDGVPDSDDACPHLAGPDDADAKKRGCPRLADDGSRTELRSIHFATNEAALLDESRPLLDEVARLLLAHPEVARVVIEGHADDTGTAAGNLRLSRKRAEAVVRYLVDKGVPARRLRPVGYGDTRPLSSDRSDEARARNRRVEMSVPSEKR